MSCLVLVLGTNRGSSAGSESALRILLYSYLNVQLFKQRINHNTVFFFFFSFGVWMELVHTGHPCTFVGSRFKFVFSTCSNVLGGCRTLSEWNLLAEVGP